MREIDIWHLPAAQTTSKVPSPALQAIPPLPMRLPQVEVLDLAVRTQMRLAFTQIAQRAGIDDHGDQL
jgi:hypothetical protein